MARDEILEDDLDAMSEAFCGAMRAIRGASQALAEGKPNKARSLLFQALAAHDNEVAWTDVGGNINAD